VGKYKVYIIDEVHMLSQSAFNAFLKTLEEPPEHAKFILATTEKHKIIPTILSRCQIFDFKRIGDDDIVEYLNFVAKQEKIEVDEGSLRLIAQKSDGAMRDSLSLFDRLCNWSERSLLYKRVVKLLNILDYDYYFKITEKLLIQDFYEVLSIFNEILENGYDSQDFIIGLAKHFRDLLVAKDTKTVMLLEMGTDLQQRYLSHSQEFSINFLLTSLNISNDADINYNKSSDQRLLVELMLLKMSSLNEISDKKKTSINNKKVLNEEVEDEKDTQKIVEKEHSALDKQSHITKVNINLDVRKKPSTILINSNQQNNDNSEKNQETEQVLEDSDFTESEMRDIWSKLIEYFKASGKSNISLALEIHAPKLLPDNIIHLLLSNSAQLEMILEEKHVILDYLRKNLKNKNIEITTAISKNLQQKAPYTNKDKFNKMVESNEHLEVLKRKLSLDTDF